MTMDDAGPVGRRLPGLGRRTASTWRPARATAPGRLLPGARRALRRAGPQAWFPFGVHLIEGLFQTARSIEATARQREALVALGTLAAGLAHEINNPAVGRDPGRGRAAATRATPCCPRCVGSRPSGSVRRAVRRARRAAARAPSHRPAGRRPAGASPTARRTLSTWLDAHGVARRTGCWRPPLAAAGVDVGLVRAGRRRARRTDARAGPASGWRAPCRPSALLAEVKESTRRISELVAAVKSYSQLDRASVQRIDVTEGLESTLVMLGAQARRRRDGRPRATATDVPRIEAIAGELNQVWTNLIDNAIDAMDGDGHAAHLDPADGDGVVVEIADTGPGMPADVQATCVRAVLHDQGRRQGHRARPRHLPPHHRGPARRRDHHRLRPGGDGAAGPAPGPTLTGHGRHDHYDGSAVGEEPPRGRPSRRWRCGAGTRATRPGQFVVIRPPSTYQTCSPTRRSSPAATASPGRRPRPPRDVRRAAGRRRRRSGARPGRSYPACASIIAMIELPPRFVLGP